MTPSEFENLVTSGQLKREAFIQGEFDGLVRSGRSRLADARLLLALIDATERVAVAVVELSRSARP